MNIELPKSSSDSENRYHGQVGRQQMRHSNSYNCARNFHEYHEAVKHRFPVPTICTKCQAKLFKSETRGLCCRNGAIVLPKIPVPEELLGLFDDQSEEGRLFRQKIRSYNHVFSFTSMGVRLDENLVNAQQGVYTFRAHRAIYHKIDSLLLNLRTRPRFLQLYIYDTEHKTDNRLLENESLDRNLLEKIKRILDDCNPFVFQFRQQAQRPQLDNYRLVIKEQSAK
ncbi:hypothetical protein LIER_40909 [Lithospermum erythrorhizon]|uniref:Uncharacterized protein n=1 Tax=Lithospermum erythrorhizon TaxID=34254 RepID=A0AAV3R754_LITER